MESLNLLMYRRPRKAKELSFKIIPTYVDDLVLMSRDYHNGSHKEGHEFNFITNYHAEGKIFPHISYMLICNLMAALKSDDRDMIKNYLTKQVDLTEKDLSSSFFNELIDKAGRYYHDFVSTQKHEITFLDEEISRLDRFAEFLKTDASAEEINIAVYEIARENNIKPQDFFKTIYHALIGQDRGPWLSNFIIMIGQEKTIEIIASSIKKSRKQCSNP